MSEDQGSNVSERIQDLKGEHRALDKELQAIANDPLVDDLQIQRLKKRKLFLKDSIAHLESSLLPDITAYLSIPFKSLKTPPGRGRFRS